MYRVGISCGELISLPAQRKEHVQPPAGTADEPPVAESIRGGRVAICQRWEPGFLRWWEGEQALATGCLEASRVLSSDLGFTVLSVTSKLERFCEVEGLA